MSSLDDRAQLISVARMYYQEGYSQQKIADLMGLSRASISLALKRCRQKGIVNITIVSDDVPPSPLLRPFKEQYPHTQLVLSTQGEGLDDSLSKLAHTSAQYFRNRIKNNSFIGIAWGSFLHRTVDNLAPLDTQGNVIVQLAGSLGFNNPVYDGLELAKTLARKLKADCYAINAPFLLQDLKAKALLSKEPQVEATLALMDKLQISLAGISSNQPEKSVLVKGGFLTWQESRAIYEEGSVGHICGMHITKEGKLHKTKTNQHIMGISFEQFKNIPHKITISSGEDRVPTIAAALQGDLINTLITDEQTVKALLIHT